MLMMMMIKLYRKGADDIGSFVIRWGHLPVLDCSTKCISSVGSRWKGFSKSLAVVA